MLTANMLARNDRFFKVHNKFSNIPLSNPANVAKTKF